MLQMTLHLTRSSRLWTLLLLGVFLLRSQKKCHFNRFYEDTQRRDFRPLEDNAFFVNVFYKSLKETFKSLEKICLAATVL
jgi:hypothetical protein